MADLVQRFQQIYEEIHTDIFKFCEYLNFHPGSFPTHQQRNILEIVQHESTLPFDERKKRIAVKSGQGPGKTTIASAIGLWRSLRFIDAMTVVTAPTLRQAREVFLAECRRLLQNADPALRYMIDVTKSKVVIGKRPKWGIECATAIRAENVQGYHEQRMTFIAEEASGVARPIIEQILGTLTNADSLFIMIGNPNTNDCAFCDCFSSQRDRWWTFTMNAEESPIVDQENVKRIRDQFGANSDVYRVRVLGKFPKMDPSCIMSADDLEDCTKTDPYVAARVGGLKKQFGIDFARFGDDESVIYQRTGYTITNHRIFNKTDPNQVVAHAFLMQHESTWGNGDCDYVADAGGMGQGVMYNFHQAKKRIHEFHTQGVSSDEQYQDAITEAFFIVADLVRAKAIHMPDDNILIQQLSTRQYGIHKKTGKIQVESKDDYKKRTSLRSPDRADAFVMCFYSALYAEGRVLQRGASSHRVGI